MFVIIFLQLYLYTSRLVCRAICCKLINFGVPHNGGSATVQHLRIDFTPTVSNYARYCIRAHDDMHTRANECNRTCKAFCAFYSANSSGVWSGVNEYFETFNWFHLYICFVGVVVDRFLFSIFLPTTNYQITKKNWINRSKEKVHSAAHSKFLVYGQ